MIGNPILFNLPYRKGNSCGLHLKKIKMAKLHDLKPHGGEIFVAGGVAPGIN
jgi:hypothetical protein